MYILFSKEVLAEVEGFSSDLVLFEDWDFWIRISRIYHVSHIDKVTAEYRFYGSSSMAEKYRPNSHWDEAKAKVFDRTLPLLNGKAWINFQNSGWLKTLQDDLKEKHKKLMNWKRRLPVPVPPLQESRPWSLIFERISMNFSRNKMS